MSRLRSKATSNLRFTQWVHLEEWVSFFTSTFSWWMNVTIIVRFMSVNYWLNGISLQNSFIGSYATGVIKSVRVSELKIDLLQSAYQQRDWELLSRQGLITFFERKKRRVEKYIFELFLVVIKLWKWKMAWRKGMFLFKANFV